MELGLVIWSIILAFMSAVGIGVQDVSNALGTSVGSKAVTVRQAIMIAGVCEFTGSLFGGSVASSISSGILAPESFESFANGPVLFAIIMITAISASFLWLMVATYFSAPVSTTHSLVGALVGVGLWANEDAIQWGSVLQMASTWVTSPLLGGMFSYILFKIIFDQILAEETHKKAALARLPYFYGSTIGLCSVILLISGPSFMRSTLDRAMLFGASVGVTTAFVVWKRIRSANVELPVSGGSILETEGLFKPLMVITAIVLSFAHGSNDVSNAIGPFTAIWNVYQTGRLDSFGSVPLWILVLGGAGIVVGLATYGHRVMATIGEKIAVLTFSRGFAAQFATAFTVLTATYLGMSVSTTHVLVGAISGVALVEGRDKLEFGTLKKIALSWIITVPAAAIFALMIFPLYIFLFAP